MILLSIYLHSTRDSFPNPGNPQVIVTLYVLMSCLVAGGLLGMRTSHLEVLAEERTGTFSPNLQLLVRERS